jgi:hypothetical protein
LRAGLGTSLAFESYCTFCQFIRQDDDQQRRFSSMTLLSYARKVVGPEPATKYSFMALLTRSLPRRITARLRHKGPLWAALVLFVLAADLLLAWLAWIAVDFVV